tara:strand:+ start:3096 stop:5120 length:2025 start_codon:yes stop_codon:yes gene_type:complete
MSDFKEASDKPRRDENRDEIQPEGTPILDNFSTDLTALARAGELDPVIGRKKEIKRIAQTLCRRKKNNPVLIGEPGCGKTAIVEGLSIMLSRGEGPRPLLDKRIVSLELTSLVAGTKYRGQFEERMKAVIDELKNNKDVIIFIDELHTVVGTGNSSGSLDAANIFKPALARGEVQCIGATTLNEYREKVEKDGALERRFQKVSIAPTSTEETLTILKQIKHKYESHHKVNYSEEALESCVKFAERYINERQFPDKAIDILDEVGAKFQIEVKYPKSIENLKTKIAKLKEEKMKVVKTQNYEKAADIRDSERKLVTDLEKLKLKWEKDQDLKRTEITVDSIMEVVSDITKIPLSRLDIGEKKELLNLEDKLRGVVIGQETAVSKISKAIKRNSVGIKDTNRPIGSFIFLGPTGVGKTYLAKQLSSHVFGSEESLIRVDMSEFQEKHALSRLIGSPPGYVGYNEGGQLTEKVRNNPYSLILFDEVEKAHPDIFNLMLQILDDGYITDSSGRKINFKNTLIIMTSNIGVKKVQDWGEGIGFSTKAKEQHKEEHMRSLISKSLRNTFNPEFLNRIDEVVIFESLKVVDLQKIVKIQLAELKIRLKEKDYDFSFGPTVIKHISEEGYDEKYGARPLQRAIQTILEDLISEEILKGTVTEGNSYFVNYNKKTNKVKIKQK